MSIKKADNDTMFEEAEKSHKIWHKFQKWLSNTYGKDLFSDWIYLDPTKKLTKYKYKSFNEGELAKRLIGYEVMERVEKYVKKHCPEIKIVYCDDALHASSLILLIPHPKHGITLLYIPQCTSIQNQFFFYENHLKSLIEGFNELKKIAYE